MRLGGEGGCVGDEEGEGGVWNCVGDEGGEGGGVGLCWGWWLWVFKLVDQTQQCSLKDM